MTVENTNSTISYTGNSSVTTFAYNFLTYSTEHLFIYFDDVLQTSGFTITGIGDDNGGDVTFVSPPITGVTIRIDRTVPDTQLLAYQEYGPFPAKANERGLDLLTMAVQQTARNVNRGKMDKRPLAAEDNIIVFDDTGNSKDSGFPVFDGEAKMDRIPNAGIGNFVTFDSNGNSANSGINTTSFFNKMDKAPTSNIDNVVIFDSAGNAKDSGKKLNEVGNGGSYIGENPPTFPQQGDRWTRCTDMKGFIYYIDADSAQWVEDRPSYGEDTIGDVSIPYIFDTVALLLSTTIDFPVKKVLSVNEYSTGSSGSGNWLVSDTLIANGTDILNMNNSSLVVQIQTDYIDTNMFGVLPTGSMSTKMTLISNYAEARNITEINISLPTIQLDSNVDCKGAIVNGNNTIISGAGRFINTPKQNGIIVNGQDSTFNATHPSIPAATGNFAINKISNNEYSVFAQKSTKGYLLMSFKNNLTTPTQSLATTTSDITSFRNVSSVNIVDCIVGFQGSGTEVGAWSTANMITGIDEVFTGGIEYTYEFASGAVSKEYTIEVKEDGYFNVGFLRSGSSTTAAEVQVDGVVIEAGINLTAGATSLDFREYKALPGIRVIKVSAPAARLNLLGVNVFKLKDYRAGFEIDQVGYYTNATNYDNYLSSTSANDYAILEKTSDIFGGSYHGGETAVSTKILLDGNELSLPIGGSSAGNSIQIEQDCSIDWTSVGGPLLDVNTLYSFVKGGYALQSAFSNTIRVESFFGTLFGINEAFSEITTPKRFDLSTVTNGDRVFYGQQNQITYKNPSNNQKIRVSHTSFDNYENAKGGSYTWVVTGLYNKYYAPFVDRGDRTVNDLSFTNIFEFM